MNENNQWSQSTDDVKLKPNHPDGTSIAVLDPDAQSQLLDNESSAIPDSLPRKPQMTWISRLGWALALTATAGISAVIGSSLVLFTPLSAAIAPETSEQNFSILDLWQRGVNYDITRPVNILVMGIDQVPDAQIDEEASIFAGRSDTMLLVQVNPETETLSLMSIPRDTQVQISGLGLTKVNHANAIGGPTLAAQVVSDTLNDIEIDRYVRVSTDAFRQLVDLFGGVEVLVPYPMEYVDQTQNLEIDLEAGLQRLTGDEAEQFARFRNDAYGDIGRVQRQQQLLQALRDRITRPTMLPRIPEAIQLLQDHIDTNLTTEEIVALADFGLELESDQLQMVMLPGRFSQDDEFLASYWILDYQGRDRVLSDYFSVEPPADSFPVSDRQSLRRMRIAVQNATDEPRIARNVANYLYDQGFTNVYLIPDWPNAINQTQIIAQRGDLNGAMRLGNVLGVGTAVAASTGDLESDLTIRVGEDWLDYLDTLDDEFTYSH